MVLCQQLDFHESTCQPLRSVNGNKTHQSLPYKLFKFESCEITGEIVPDTAFAKSLISLRGRETFFKQWSDN